MSSDMNFMDIFFPSENGIFKNSVKDEFIDQSYNDDAIDQQSSYSFLKTEEWSPDPDPEDIFDSLLNFEDNQFDLIDNDLKVLPSSSSDSGLSSALSLANEEQLSPPLATEDDQIEISNSPAGTPQNIMDFDLDSPSVDSPMISYSLINSNIGSPATDVAEEMDEDQTVVAVVHPNNTFADVNTIVEEPDIKLERVAKPPKIHIVPQEENTINLRNMTGNGKRNIRKLIRVTPMGSNNPRSILLPVNLTDMKEVKTIKIINASQAKNFKGFKINQSSLINKQIQRIKEEDSSSERGNSSDEVFECDSQYPRLKLTAEEKRLLQKEGIKLPSHYPLTKQEERELKRIRRKIRNKISAQDSRKRKKEYVDGLEDRVKQCTDENISLLKRIKALQIQNQSLAGQLKRLQALLQKGNKSAPPSTCLIVLLLSLALIAVPNLLSDSNSNNEMAQEQEQSEKMPPLAGRSRALLYTKQLMDEELQQYNEELLQEVEGLLDHDYSPAIQLPLSKRPRMEPEPKYVDHVGGTLGGCQETTIRKYIEPPLDDVWPPPKPGGQKIVKVFDKLEALTNELKINISDSEGTRTVLVKMPQEQ